MAIEFNNSLKPEKIKKPPYSGQDAVDMIRFAKTMVKMGRYKSADEALKDLFPDVDERGIDMKIPKPKAQTQPKTNAFNKWLDTFISEKGIDPEEGFDLEGESGTNMMNYGVIIDHMKATTPQEQAKLKDMIVKLDFKNADIKDYLRHLGKAIVK